MTGQPSERNEHYRSLLAGQLGVVERLPPEERGMVRSFLDGQSVSEVAQDSRVSEGAVWTVLDSLARMASGGNPGRQTEVGGLGSDTDPGVTGGYGDTGFGSIGNEPPNPILEEPEERPEES